MPYPTFVRFWLDPKTRGAADDFGAQLTGFLEAQHHDDGTHGDITADSLIVSGDVTIGGSLLGDLTVTGDVTINGALTAATASIGGVTFAGLGSFSGVGLNLSGTLAAATAESSNQDFLGQPIWKLFESSGVGALQLTRDSDGTVLIQLDEDIRVNTNKFTVDGATGDTGIAGMLTASQSSGSLVRHKLLNTNAGHIQTDLDIGAGSGTADLFVGVNTGGTNAYIDNRSGGDFLIQQSGSTKATFATGGGITFESTFRAKGALRFDNYPGGFLEADGSGNISANVTVLQQNGVNFGPGMPTSITVVDGQVTAIS